MLELLFGHVNVPAWGAECSAVLAVVWACLMLEAVCSDAKVDAEAVLAVGWACACMGC